MSDEITKVFTEAETIIPTTMERCVPLRNLRKYIKRFRIREKQFKYRLCQDNSHELHPYIETLVQKLYHPTDEDLKMEEMLLDDIRIY